MKRYINVLFALLICGCAMAQDIYVYATIGSAEVKRSGNWQKLKKRDALKSTDIIRVGENSALSLIDKKAEKVYSISKCDENTVSQTVETVKSKQPSMSAQFFNHAMKSLFNGEADKISHSAAGCTYRGDIVENDIAKALAGKCKESGLKNIANEKTDMAVSFEIIDRNSGKVISAPATIGTQTYFRIKNNSSTALYVNVLDVNSQGENYACLPMDDAQTMSHLLIPANSTVDLAEFPMEFAEPVGLDCFIMIAVEQPYDLRLVEKYLENNVAPSTNAIPVGIYKKELMVR